MRLLASVLLLAMTAADLRAAAGDVTFNRDIAPILFKHCSSCHRPGEVGPFSLLTYADAAKRAGHLAEVTREKLMPPWHAESTTYRFVDDRRLSRADIDTINRWADTGAKQGDPKDLPPLPKFAEGWQLGAPDVIVKLPKPVDVPAEGNIIKVFSVPIPIDQVKWIKGIEFRPGNRRIVHHANLFLDTTGEMRKNTPKDDALVVDLGADRPALQAFPGLIGAWTPGHMPQFLPDEIVYPVRPKTDVVFQIHYQASGRAESDQSSVGLYFADRPGRRYAVPVPLSISPPFKNTQLLEIPAGRKRHKVELTSETPADAYVYAIHTHAHYLLRDAVLTATPPGGKPVTLLEIKNWDFNWQDRYVYSDRPRLPKGTRLDLVAYFDNSSDNPQNPSHPPRDVHFGISSTDEMLNSVLVLLPTRDVAIPSGGFVIPADAKILREKYDTNKDGKLSAEEIAALPPRIRLKVESMIDEQASVQPPAEAKKPAAKDEKSGSTFRLPPDGFPLPADAKLLREKYDTNKDGKLSQQEFDAIPMPLKQKVEEMIRNRLAKDAPKASKVELQVLPPPREAIPVVPAPETVTFTRDVAPILFAHCATCHRPGEVGPFSLLTYKDAVRRASHLAEATRERRMPPWLPEPGPHRFLEERRLSDGELAVLDRWARAGAPEGDSRDLPPAPKFTDGWQLGPPDLIIKMPKPFVVPADGSDVYQAIVLPIPITEQKWVKGFEFRPGNRKVAHHANLLLDLSGKLRERAEKENGPGFRTTAGIEARQAATGALGGWRPGTTARFSQDFARPIRPGTDVVFNIHYHPSGKVDEDQSYLGLYFTDKPSQKRLFNLSLFVSPDAGNEKLLEMPAGTPRHDVSLSKIVPADALAYWVTPHAHYLLKQMKLTARFPTGETVSLLEIKNWDFNQQDIYYYERPVKLPKGTRLDLTGYYDNTANNPQNPSSPPVAVRWGERTTDEMFASVLGIVAEGEDAEKKYRELFAKKPAQGTAMQLKKADDAPLKLPPGGFVLPADAKLLREKYDTNKDGKLSQEELEIIPQPLRSRVEEMIRKKLEGGIGPKSESKTPPG